MNHLLTKQCSGCRQVKPFDAYGPKKSGLYGLKARCKVCLAKDTREYQLVNRERVSAQQKRWAERNLERKRQKDREWYLANIEQRRELARQWSRANPDKVMANVKARKSRAQRFAPWADRALIADLYRYARIMRAAGVSCEVDHIVPLRGQQVSGLHVETNLSVLLTEHNRAKSARFEV